MQCVRCNGVMDRFVERADRRGRLGAEGWRCLECGVVPGIVVTTPFARWRRQVSRPYAGSAASPSLAVATETSSAVSRPVPPVRRAKISVLRPKSPTLRLVSNRRANRVVERVRAMDATDTGLFRLRASSRHLRLVPPSAQPVDVPTTVAPRCALCDAALETEGAQREHQAVCVPASQRALGFR